MKPFRTVKQLLEYHLDNGDHPVDRPHQRMTNPLLKAGLITETVAAKIPNQMTSKKYLELSDE